VSASSGAERAPSSPLPTPPEFPVHWEEPADERSFWTLDGVHAPRPLTPLSFDFARFSFEHGIVQAYRLPIRVQLRRINTYLYQSITPEPIPVAEVPADEQHVPAPLHAAMFSLATDWATRWLPEVKTHLGYWEQLELSGSTLPILVAVLEETIERTKRLWEIHFKIVQPALVAMSMFEELYGELFGADMAPEARRLLQGFGNQTLDANSALWQLSRGVRRSPSLRAALAMADLAEVTTALAVSPEGRRFLNELRGYLDEHGQRGDALYELSSPSWIEDPTPVVQTVRDALSGPIHDPLVRRRALAREREQLLGRARQRLCSYPSAQATRFEALVKAAQEGTIVHEDHNAWIDYRIAYHVRQLLLEFGRRFAGAGAFDAPEDIFYLTLNQVRETAARLPAGMDDHRVLVRQRRAEMASFRRIPPPLMIGTPPAAPPPNRPFERAMARVFGVPPAPAATSNTLKGGAAAPGMARGPARVVRSLAQVDIVRSGDVLVVETAQPPWTSLFPIVAAIVTDHGGVLSHCAVVAREYGLPAVVGTGTATRKFRDGQLLEVDGNAGSVRAVENP
jgi:phosphohistidine swiveling domain-containing protein